MDSFASYTEFKRQDNAAYKLLNRVAASDSYVGGDMRQGGWYIKSNPQFVTDAQCLILEAHRLDCNCSAGGFEAYWIRQGDAAGYTGNGCIGLRFIGAELH